jgi:hypothetical protein
MLAALHPFTWEPEMKYLLIPLALAAGSAMACPGDDAKNATAPTGGKEAAATTARAAPAASRSTAAAPAAKTAPVKVAAKPAADARKSTPL